MGNPTEGRGHGSARSTPIPPSAFQALLDNAPVGIWLLGPDGRLVFVNRTFCEAVGIAEEVFLRASHYSELFEPETARRCMVSDAQAMDQPGPHVSRERLGFTDGRVHDVEIVKAQVLGRDERLTGIIAVSQDITARVEAEALAAHQLEGLRHLNALATLPGIDMQEHLREALRIGAAHLGLEAGAICRVEGEAVRIEAQVGAAPLFSEGERLSRAETLTGQTLAGPGVLAIADFRTSPLARDALGLRFPVGAFVGVPLRLADQAFGSISFASARAREGGFALADTEFASLLGRWVEAALERKRAFEALQDSQARLAGVIDTAMDAIISLDDRQRIVVFNAAAERIFRCQAKEAIGAPLERFLPDGVRERHAELVRRFVEHGETSRTGNRTSRITGRRTTGEEFPCEASISRAWISGRWLATAILRDVTEQVRAEELARQAEIRGQQAQRLEALGTLAGGIAHDFNSVLHVVLMSAQSALDAGGAPPEVAEALTAVCAAGERGRDLVRRILAFSRRLPQQRSAIDLLPVVEEATRFMRAVLPAGVQVSATLRADVPRVVADSTEILQIVMNLCSNAWQAHEGPNGRIEIRLDPEERCGPGPETARRRYARLSVSDSGRGMDESTRARIFEPFFTTKAPGHGTGLGLSTVHTIVRDAGGFIEVRSALGEGSEFVVLLPEADPAVGATLPPSMAAPTARGERILLVDSEELVLRATSKVLRGSGFLVDAQTGPETAIAAVRDAPGRYAAVLTDFHMPLMSGMELADALRRVAPALPILVMSGHLTEEEASRGRELGVEVLLKPCSGQDLQVALMKAIAGARG